MLRRLNCRERLTKRIAEEIPWPVADATEQVDLESLDRGTAARIVAKVEGCFIWGDLSLSDPSEESLEQMLAVAV